MSTEKSESAQPPAPLIRIRLPGFILEEPLGLGDAIQHSARSLGIAPCGSCQRRAATLNRWLAFTKR